jgi:hypothetical protein
MIPEERMKNNLIPFEEDAIREYLDSAIRFWHRKRDRSKEEFTIAKSIDESTKNILAEAAMAKYYIDAFQSVRMTLFGELLSVEKGD